MIHFIPCLKHGIFYCMFLRSFMLSCSQALRGVLRRSEALRLYFIATLFQRLSEALRGSHVVIYGILSGSQALRHSAVSHALILSEALRGVLSVPDRIMVLVQPHTVSEALRGSQALSEALYVVPLYLEMHSETDFIFSTLCKAHSVLVSCSKKAHIVNILTATVVLFRIAQQCIIPSCYGQVIVSAQNSGISTRPQLATMPCGDAP